jgi:molybdopterin-containing oxidoreductase family iron-sulfur binding subunit
MYWMLIQRYWTGEFPDIKPDYIPMMCQQCSKAPCEPVCPVFASVHSESESINLQVYNRCVGTRYCGNNCPYLARTFNWFDYQMPAPMDSYLNPNVTVRRRGVMEKCTFCLQRIQNGQFQAKAEKRKVLDGEIIPACAQACPTSALIFGDLSDPDSQISQLARSQRRFQYLTELGIQPSVIYLKGGGRYGS